MKLNATWTGWTPWAFYVDRETLQRYRTRRRQLRLGKLLLATLIQADYPRYKKDGVQGAFFMYSGEWPSVVDRTEFKVVRRFIRETLR